MKEYTLLSLIAAALVFLLDHRLRTRVLRTRIFWIFLLVMYAFKLIANGYLTWRPIVLYNPAFFLGVRLGTIPLEDFVYGFSIIGFSVVLWEYLKRRGETRP